MPRTERAKRDADKKNKKTANATGQTKIASFFKSQEISGQTSTHDDETAEREVSVPTVSGDACDSGPERSTVIADPWIKIMSEFNDGEKLRSKTKGRFFQSEWLRKYEWLSYHREKQAAFCETCTEYRQAHDNSPFIFTESAVGFCNWKKGVERLTDHEQSENHKNATKQKRSSQPTLDIQIDSQIKEQQRLRRQGLVAHLNTLKTLLRQGVAIRGHTDEDSNIIQFNKDKAIDHEGLNLLLKENQYMSHDILVEQEETLVLRARRSLIDDINASKFYAIICDESSDISKNEQSFSVRHCTEDYDVLEDFIGVMPCDEGLSSEALLKYLQDVLVRCNMNTQKMAGMAFDGASAMKRLAVLLKDEVCKHALYIHWFAHCNELVFKDVTSLSRMVADAQDFCENMYALVGVSPKRVLLFQNIQKEVSEENTDDGRSNLKLKNLSRTRWTTRGAAADVILKKNHELQETLETLSADSSVTPECREKSKGLLQKLKSLPNTFNLLAMNELAFLLENNSKQLQRADLTAEQVSTSITSA
ncbi:uncharacterized protein LOC114530150 [Dendronephthya gigantea]|uniref:uncharacterized protein LOC114530150 n=1 Tax=Dendronephthya gigantea TaxID=151771 RepID=UPI00106929C3|nr:uncharacterized protein LOC114530150 [Dendronephthya gigantea]